MGITALISTLLGFLGGALPDLIKEVRDSRAASREADFLRLQHELQVERMKLEAGAKLREAESGIIAEEVRAIREQVVAAIEAGSRPTGVIWIDGFNALIRPLTAMLVMLLFIVTAGGFVASVLAQYQAGQIATAAEMANVLWGSQIGFAIEAVLGFLFGARQVRKMSQ
jgi:hypothetical protein